MTLNEMKKEANKKLSYGYCQIWENDEAFYFEDIEGGRDNYYGPVIYKDSGIFIDISEYFKLKETNDVFKLFKIHEE